VWEAVLVEGWPHKPRSTLYFLPIPTLGILGQPQHLHGEHVQSHWYGTLPERPAGSIPQMRETEAERAQVTHAGSLP
jgi:hypothetical protein